MSKALLLSFAILFCTGSDTTVWRMAVNDTVVETPRWRQGAPGDLTNIYGWKWMNEHVPQPASCTPTSCHRRNAFPRR